MQIVWSSSLRILARNLRWGIVWGLRIAGTFAAVATALVILSPSPPFRPGEPSYWQFLFLYLSVGFVGGATVGLLRPFVKTAVGSISVGILVAWTSLACVFLEFVARDGWSTIDTILVSLGAMVGGPLAAVILRSQLPRDS